MIDASLNVFSGPSGAGKSSILKKLLAQRLTAELSVSYTTRAIRGVEKDGVDYHFVDEATFRKMIVDGEFLEWAEVHGKFYGTSRKAVMEKVLRGTSVFLDIDVQGHEKLLHTMREESRFKMVSFFIEPPSVEVLRQRLVARGDTKDIELRLENASREIDRAGWYDHRVVNHEGRLDQAVAQILKYMELE